MKRQGFLGPVVFRLVWVGALCLGGMGLARAQILTLQTPNGGELWRRNEAMPITWTSTLQSGQVRLELLQGGTFVGTLVRRMPVGRGSWLWRVGRLEDGTPVSGAGLLLRVVTDTSSSPWMSVPPPLVPSLPPAEDTTHPQTLIDILEQGQPRTDAQILQELQNALTGGGTIVFQTHGQVRTLHLTRQLTIPVQGVPPAYDRPVVLDGGGFITLDGGADAAGQGGTRILEKAWKVVLTVQGIHFQNGNAGNVTSGHADDDRCGGAINVENWDGSLVVRDCRFTNCRAIGSGPDVGGGAVHCPGQRRAWFINSVFEDCQASNGGAINSLGSELQILNCRFERCEATGTGGGADAGPAGQGGIGGGVYVDGVSQNAAHACFRLEHSEVLDCGANDHGGGIFLYTIESSGSELLLNSSRFSGNRITGASPRVGFAGGIYVQNGALTISSCTFDANRSVSMGGAVWWLSSLPAQVVNSTFYANRSGNFASALQVSGPIRLANCTVLENVSEGTFGGALRAGSADQVWLKNMVFSRNTCLAQASVADVSGTCRNGGGNVQWPPTPGRTPISSAVVWADPLLGPLGDHGGPCPTCLPAEASPLVDGGVEEDSPSHDQRGWPRLGRSDCGAVEHQRGREGRPR